ncbi:alanine--tRNA ligase-related protein [Streptomyces sp. NPDC048751]|uniref:alanine--tRNA ligase-related protein n=1 Tax=Streptomyces sp. NPDC048751 TaxID=3365591 RepID=UPI003717890B
MSDVLAAQGYRWQPPPPLVPSDRAELFPSHLAPSWIDPLLGSLAHARGGVHTVRWSIAARHLDAVPVAMPPSAQRVLSAVWAGPRPFHVSIEHVTQALAGVGVCANELAFVVSAHPSGSHALREALARLGVKDRQIGFDWRTVSPVKRAVLAGGPHLRIEFPVGSPCWGTCGPGCRCGRYLVLAHLQFSPASQVRSLLEVAVLESELLSAVDDTREPFGVRRFEALVKSVHEVLPAHGTPRAQAQRVRLLVDRAFTAALLIGSGFLPGPRGRPHVVRRLLRNAATELALTGVSLTRLEGLVKVADRTVRTPLGFTPLADHLLETVREERERFARVLARAPLLLEGAVTPRHQPAERARALLRLRGDHGVPLGVAVAWCREHGIAVSLRHLARLDRDRHVEWPHLER